MRIFIILLILYQVINCGEKSQSDEFPNLIFRNDESLASQMITYDNISLSIPSNLEKIVGDKYLNIEKNIETLDSSYFKTDVLSIYQSLDGMVCIISKIRDEKTIYDRLDKEFESGLTKSLCSRGEPHFAQDNPVIPISQVESEQLYDANLNSLKNIF